MFLASLWGLRSKASLRSAKKDKPSHSSCCGENKAKFAPFAVSPSGVFGPAALGFLRKVEASAKRQGNCSTRHSLRQFDSTWNAAWFSTFPRKRLGAANGTNAAFNADSAAAAGGPSLKRPSGCFPRRCCYCVRSALSCYRPELLLSEAPRGWGYGISRAEGGSKQAVFLLSEEKET